MKNAAFIDKCGEDVYITNIFIYRMYGKSRIFGLVYKDYARIAEAKVKKVLVSACILGANCKYNGENNFNAEIVELLKGREIVSVCPEALSGAGTPRPPAEIREGKVYDIYGRDVDELYRKGTERALRAISCEDIVCAILQPRSPTCGVREIYDGTFTGKLIEGRGIFARALADTGIPVYDADDVENIKKVLALTED